jgi:hypothetical protein
MPRKPARIFDARPDTVDFRDRMFVPTLVEVPEAVPLSNYLKRWNGRPLVLDQGSEGACTGFGLAAVCNFLLRVRKVRPSRTPVSPRMLYAMARRYDEWPGEDYDGSSARGAMKGWHKHGVCSETAWPRRDADGELDGARARDAARRPLGAYLRVNHKDLVAMHAALAEAGILYACATTHSGWERVRQKDGTIPEGNSTLGGHAFAIVGYDRDGLWIQNSWGRGWGKGGFARLPYDDWLEHGYDVWAARLGVPVTIRENAALGVRIGGLVTAELSYADLRSHVVTLGNDGRLRRTGTYANTPADLERIVLRDLPRITSRWKKKRILLYAHGGLVPEKNALQRIENYVPVMREREVFPLAFVWRTDLWTTVKNLLADALRRRRTERILDDTKDFLLDRLDDALERLARMLGGKAVWAEMKENALLATAREDGGARQVARLLGTLADRDPSVEIHLAAHSAGSILLAPLVGSLTAPGAEGRRRKIATCTLWAPAASVALFRETYLPAIRRRAIGRYAQFHLTDAAERDDHCARLYNKSLLYLVSNALEEAPRPFLRRDGTPIVGMAKFVEADGELAALFRSPHAVAIAAPNGGEPGSPDASGAVHHGDFDDDRATLAATLARITGRPEPGAGFVFPRSAVSTAERRQRL